VTELLDDHVDGLLPAPEAEAIRDHLDACGPCRETLLAMKAASASLSTWNDAEPPADCFEKIRAKIAAIPDEALATRAPRRAIPMMPRFSEIDVAKCRRVATGSLAAAAAVLGAIVVTHPATRSTHRLRPTTIPSVELGSAAWFPGSSLDDGLRYEINGRPVWPRARPAAFEIAAPR